MKSPEILAPAGSWEALLAALRCGADAVYGGGKQFSARHRAENFTSEQLEQAVRLCHLYGAKFYLTVNTLLFDTEFDSLKTLLHQAADLGVDALLVQDLGVLDCVRKTVPDMPIHGSTQMTIHTPAGVLWAKEQGLSRVVVARELSRQEIRRLCGCGVEIEQFVHGALCTSVSGQCGLSAVIGSRSANRGQCAQICRLPFSACNHPSHCALSLKDLCLVPYVQQMAADGVASLKIEGRCKRPEYVAAAVTALQRARAGEEPDLQTLQAVFSRSGFTDGYYTAKRQAMYGVRCKEDVLRGKAVLPQLAQLYQKPLGIVPLDLHVTMQLDDPISVRVSDACGHILTVYGAMPQLAVHQATDTAQLTQQFGKLGGTIYTLRHLTADCDGKSMLPVSALNRLRRDCVAQMDALRVAQNTPLRHFLSQAEPEISKGISSVPRFRVWCSTWDDTTAQLLTFAETEAILLPATVAETVPQQMRHQVYLTLPRFCAAEEKIHKRLEMAKDLGFSHLVCENVSHLKLGATCGFTLHGGLGLNVTNSRSLSFLKEAHLQDALLSPELTRYQAKACTGLPIGLYVYGTQPVMTMRNCPIREEVGCKNCRHRLKDRTGRIFSVYCTPEDGITTLYNAVPTWMADKLDTLSFATYWLLDCTHCADPLAVLRAYQARATTDAPMTRGLFYRGVK